MLTEDVTEVEEQEVEPERPNFRLLYVGAVLVHTLQLLHPFRILHLISSFFHHFNTFKTNVHLRTRRRLKLLTWLREALPPGRKVRDLTSVWRDGTILCDLMESLVPGSCSDDLRKCHSHKSIHHAQILASRHLGMEPAFSDEDLNQVIFSSYLERRLVRYLISIRCAVLDRKLDNNTLSRHLRRFTGNKTRTQEPKPEPKPLPLDCVVKGMGLVMAVQERRASFYIYLLQSPHLPSPPEIPDPDIVVKVEGPGSDHGELIIQRIYSKKPTKHTKTRSQSLMFHSTKSACNIPINYNLTSRYIRVNYMPQNPGRHELWVLRRGHHVPGSPYQVSVDRKADDSSVHTTSGVSDDEDAKRDRPRRRKIRVIFRVVDFVSEKMLLSDDGKLQKLTANTTSEERITRQLAEDNTEDTTENNEGVESLNETQKISASSVTSPQRKGRNSLERSEARKTKHDLDFFRDKCRKVMLLCRFLLSQSSSKESLKMLNTAGHILDGRPVRMTDRTYRLLENAVSAMKQNRREGQATRDHIINENISSSSPDHYKSVLKDYKPELPHFIEDEEHENALSSTDIPKNRTEETSSIRVDVDVISSNTTSQISPDVLDFERSSTIQEDESNDRNISDTNMKRNKKVNFCLEAVHIGESEGTAISDHELETSSPSFGESNLVFVKNRVECGERSEHTSQIKEDNEQIIDDTQESITHCNVKELQENPTEEFFAETKIPSNYYKEKEKHRETSNLADLGENEPFCVKTDTNTNHMEHPMKIDDDFLLDTTQNKIITVMEYRENNIDTYVFCDKIDNKSEEEKTECGVFCNDESEGLNIDNISNKTETKEDNKQTKSNPDSDFIDSNQCSLTDITNETLNNDVSICETISTSHNYSRQDSISVLTPILERSREDDLIQLETNDNNLHISEVSEHKTGVGPASSSSPSNASSQGTSNIFPDLEDLLGQDFTNYMSGDRHDRHFHLWPSDAEFASRPGNEFDDSMIDFDSVLAAPNLEEALLKLEQVTKERNSNEMDTVSTEESASLSPGSEVDNGNEQADDVEEDPIEGQSLSYDIGDSDYVSLDDIQSSFKQSPDNDPNGEKHVPNETENVEATIDRKTCDFQHRENNNTRSGFMGPAEREIWGISDDSVGVAGLSEENEQSLENIMFSSRTIVKGSKVMASIEEEKEDEVTCGGEEIAEIEEIHEVVKQDKCLTSESVRNEDKCMISEMIFTPETLISSIEEMNNNLVGKEGSENQQYKEHAVATDNIPGTFDKLQHTSEDNNEISINEAVEGENSFETMILRNETYVYKHGLHYDKLNEKKIEASEIDSKCMRNETVENSLNFKDMTNTVQNVLLEHTMMTQLRHAETDENSCNYTDISGRIYEMGEITNTTCKDYNDMKNSSSQNFHSEMSITNIKEEKSASAFKNFTAKFDNKETELKYGAIRTTKDICCSVYENSDEYNINQEISEISGLFSVPKLSDRENSEGLEDIYNRFPKDISVNNTMLPLSSFAEQTEENFDMKLQHKDYTTRHKSNTSEKSSQITETTKYKIGTMSFFEENESLYMNNDTTGNETDKVHFTQTISLTNPSSFNSDVHIGQSETTSSKEWSITATHLSPVDSSCIDVTNDEQQITSDASRPISVPRRNAVAMDTDTSRPLVQEETACHDKLANQVDEIFHEIFDMTEKDYLVNIESVVSDSKDYTEYFEVPSTDERTIITLETGTEIVLGDKNVFNNNDVHYIEPVTSIQLINENPRESYSQSNFLTESDVLPQEVEGIVKKSDDVNTSEEKGNAFEVQNNVSDCKYTQEQPNLLEEDLNNGFPTSFRVTQRKEFWDKKLMRQNVARYEQETKNEQKYEKFHPDIPHDIFNKDTVIDSSTKLQTSVDIKGIVKQCKYVFDRQDSSIELRAEKNPSYSSSKVSDWKKYWSNVVEAQSNATNRHLKSGEDTKRRAELNNVPNLVKIARLRFEEDSQNKITGITEFDTSLEDSNKHDIDLNKSSERINSNPVSIYYNDKYSTSLRIPGEERYESCRNSHEVTFTANNKTLQSTSGTEATDEFKNELYRARLVQITDDGYRTPTPQSMLFFTSHNIPHDGRAEVCSEQNSSNRHRAPIVEQQEFNCFQTKCYQHNISGSNTEAKKDSLINNQCIESQRDGQHNFNNYRTKYWQQNFENVNMKKENRLFVNNSQVKKKEINGQHSLTNFKTNCCQQIFSSTNMNKENNPIVNNGQCVEKDINDKLCHLANDQTKLNNSNIENENISASNTVQHIFSKMYRQQNTTGHDTKHIIAEHDKNTLLKAASNDFTKKFHTKSIIDDGSRSECKMRYEKAKLFFEKLEKSDNTANVKHNRMPSGYNKINRSLDLGRTSYEIDERTAWGSDPVLDQKKRQTISFEKTPEVPISKKKRCNRCGRVKRKKKVTESSSAPTSDTETNSRYLVLKSNTELFGGSERLPKKKISERFHVKDLFKDVIGDHDSRTGSGGIFKGIPHREAVLAALRSIDNSSSTRLMSPYERHEDCLHDVDIFFQSERL
ncbi:uro-adherence factor A-like isoform X2 [Periplaneta americana]|uniref:uro-adherence factor A-like isoform X2 n=1 Tax=Periplaneta americana TaxID=6978 RepID=UPI0037E7BF7A